MFIMLGEVVLKTIILLEQRMFIAFYVGVILRLIGVPVLFSSWLLVEISKLCLLLDERLPELLLFRILSFGKRPLILISPSCLIEADK